MGGGFVVGVFQEFFEETGPKEVRDFCFLKAQGV
jgi:hypothetical protein